MDITSLGFLLFLGAGIALYYVIPGKHQWKWLLVLSFVFVYASSPFGFGFLAATSLLAFSAGKRLESAQKAEKRRILIAAAAGCLGVLVLLKYVAGIPAVARLALPDGMPLGKFVRRFLLPIGLSYYTLQLISYLVDVSWGRMPAERSYGRLLLFTCYFPALVQGPISKYGELAPELFREHPFRWENVKFGLQLMLWGFFKKMLIADRIGVYVGEIFRGTPCGLTAWAGLVYYGIQLYCDFSGGIDVVRGVSQCMGIALKENFRQPYFSLSLGEFWRRWHISLGAWMKEYVFYPVSMSKWMGSLKKGLKKHVSRKMSNRIAIAAADLLVFLLVGVWHGLGTNFLAWGAYNGIILALSALLTDAYAGWKKALRISDTGRLWRGFCLIRTLAIVTVGWIFDCTHTAAAAARLFLNLFDFGRTDFAMLHMADLDIAVLAVACCALLVVDLLHEKAVSVRMVLNGKPYLVQAAFWTVVVQLLACFGVVALAGGFMYANF